jgi:hypothetical protein
MKRGLFVIRIILFLLIVSACQKNGPEKMPGIDVPTQNINNQLNITAPNEINTFKIGDNVRFVLANISNNPIILPENYGVHIFTNQDNKWKIIDNNFEYPSGEKEVLPKQNQQFREVVFAIHPIVEGNQPVTIRVFIVGNIHKDSSSSGQLAGAYIDVNLKP